MRPEAVNPPAAENQGQQNAQADEPTTKPAEEKVADAKEREEDIAAFNRLKDSIVQGWNHIIQIVTDDRVDEVFQKFAEDIGKKSYFEITPHKPMERFFRKCLAFKDVNKEPEVDLQNERSIDYERIKFQAFLDEVATTAFKKSLSLDEIETELEKAVKETVEGFEESIKLAKKLKRDTVIQDLQVFTQIFRYLQDDDDGLHDDDGE